MTPGDRIKKRREEMNIPVIELAEAIGKSRATVYRYENGFIDDIPINIMRKIASVLRTSPTYLMGMTDDPSHLLSEKESASAPVPPPAPQPVTKQARILSGVADIMPEADRALLLQVAEKMFEKYFQEYERMEHDDSGL